MRVYAILILFIHKIFANDANIFNVGTVLFSPDELNKNDWSLTDVGLLRARRYFQYVLPHPFLVDPAIDHFADLILDYFTNAVNIVKREETDPVSADILTTAIFDTIGGYMKSYVLPVAKYGYYGGTVSKEDAQKLYQFYDDIKTYLKTDGSGWASFDGKFQKPLKIIASLPRDYVRATRESCDVLAFYEETPSGFTIPLPTINFGNKSAVMFVPVKGHSLVCLHSPSSANALLNYYHAAKNCLKTRSPHDEAEFDKRFRTWLTDDVIAHLDEDDGQLYYALGGILTLATDNKGNECLFPPTNSSNKPYIHINFGSKKVMIVAIILFLEVVWCIPALLYMLYRRRKKKKDGSDMLLFVNPNKDKDDDQFLSSSCIQTQSSMSTSCDENTCESVKKFKKKYFRIDDTRQFHNPSSQKFEVQTSAHVIPKCSKGTSNRSCLCTKQCATESYNVEHERPITKPMRSALKNSSAPIFNMKPSHFTKPRLFESYNNVKIIGKPSIKNVGVKYLQDNRSPIPDDISRHSKIGKSKGKILSKSIEDANNNRQSSDEQAVIQIESYTNMRQLCHSNKSIEKEPDFNQISDLCKSSLDTLIQEKSNTDCITLQQSKDKINISQKQSQEKTDLRKSDSSAVTQNVENKIVSPESHQNIIMCKPKENMLREYKSYDNTINVRQSHAYTIVSRKSDDDARTHQKSIQDVLIPGNSNYNLVNKNKLSKCCKSGDTTMTIQKFKNEVIGHNGSDNPLQLYCDDVRSKDLTVRQSLEGNEVFTDPHDALVVIENLDQEAKNLQKSTKELMQLMDERRGTCGNPICECTCCLKLDNDKSFTEMQKLKTCATITLIADDDFSEKRGQTMKTLNNEERTQETETNLAPNTSRSLINASILSITQTKPGVNSRSPSLNPIPKSSKLSTADARFSAKEEINALVRNKENKDEKSVTKQEKKGLTKKIHKKVEKIIEDKVEKKVEKTKRNYGFKFTGGNKALFEVKIEKPHAAISVGIARGNAKISKSSRIPTRIIRDNLVRFDDNVSVFHRPLEAPVGSKIPLPVRKTTDDIVLRHSRNKATTPDPRLNVTL